VTADPPPLTAERRFILMTMLMEAARELRYEPPSRHGWDALVRVALQHGAGLRESPRPTAAEFARLRGMSVGSVFAGGT
jgi:hypothetical protein